MTKKTDVKQYNGGDIDKICIRRGHGLIKDCEYHRLGQDCNTCDYDPN